MESPIYVDFDETLAHPDTDRRGEVIRIIPRPGAGVFLQRLAAIAPVYILSYAVLDHVRQGLKTLGPAERHVSGILTREDLQPVIDQLERILTENLPSAEREARIGRVQPIVPSGVIFDDQPVGSWYHLVKSTATGAGNHLWIRVPEYGGARHDDALDRAYRRFHRIFVGTAFLGARS